jgi:hypothetical protein
MEKCGCCQEIRKFELEKRNESNRQVYELQELPVVTQEKGIVVMACPVCDGDLLELANRNGTS